MDLNVFEVKADKKKDSGVYNINMDFVESDNVGLKVSSIYKISNGIKVNLLFSIPDEIKNKCGNDVKYSIVVKDQYKNILLSKLRYNVFSVDMLVYANQLDRADTIVPRGILTQNSITDCYNSSIEIVGNSSQIQDITSLDIKVFGISKMYNSRATGIKYEKLSDCMFDIKVDL